MNTGQTNKVTSQMFFPPQLHKHYVQYYIQVGGTVLALSEMSARSVWNEFNTENQKKACYKTNED